MATKFFTVKQRGGFAGTERFFRVSAKKLNARRLEKYGQMGLEALAAATPVRTGKTAASWKYRVISDGETLSIRWENDNTAPNGDNIVVLLVRGHGTKNGHYVKGVDFVNPALEPVFDKIARKAWAEVTSDGR